MDQALGWAWLGKLKYVKQALRSVDSSRFPFWFYNLFAV